MGHSLGFSGGNGPHTLATERLELRPTVYDDSTVTRWEIIDVATAETVGSVGFFGREPGDTVLVGYEIANHRRRCGLATEALTAVLGHAAATGVRTVAAETGADHTASRRVMEKVGMTIADIDGQRVRYVFDCRPAVRSAT